MPMAPSPPVIDIAVLVIVDGAAAVADALQQRAVRADAVGVDRTGKREVDRPALPGPPLSAKSPAK